MTTKHRLYARVAFLLITAGLLGLTKSQPVKAGQLVYTFSGALTQATGPTGDPLPGFTGPGQAYTGTFVINEQSQLTSGNSVIATYNDPSALFTVYLGSIGYDFVTYHSAIYPSTTGKNITLRLFQGTPSRVVLNFQSTNYLTAGSLNHDFSQADFEILGGPTMITSLSLPDLTIGPVGAGSMFLQSVYFNQDRGIVENNYLLTGTVSQVTQVQSPASVPEPASLLLAGIGLACALGYRQWGTRLRRTS